MKILRVAGIAALSRDIAPVLIVYILWVGEEIKKNKQKRKYKYVLQTVISIMKTKHKIR